MFIIVASCVIDLGLEVKAFREAMCGCSSLGYRVRVDLIGRDRELGISEILLMVDPWGDRIELVTTHWVISDCDLGKVSVSTPSKDCVGLHMHVVGCVCA